MLTLNDVEIRLQNFGTRYAIFLSSTNKTAIEERYYAFWNQNTTGGELEWWSDNVAMFWIWSTKNTTCDDKLRWALAQIALKTILRDRHTKGSNPWPDACDMAAEWYDSIDHVTWLSFNVTIDLYGMGDSVSAEKNTGNFNDDVVAQTLTRNGVSNLEATKNLEELSDEEPEPATTT